MLVVPPFLFPSPHLKPITRYLRVWPHMTPSPHSSLCLNNPFSPNQIRDDATHTKCDDVTHAKYDSAIHTNCVLGQVNQHRSDSVPCLQMGKASIFALCFDVKHLPQALW